MVLTLSFHSSQGSKVLTVINPPWKNPWNFLFILGYTDRVRRTGLSAKYHVSSDPSCAVTSCVTLDKLSTLPKPQNKRGLTLAPKRGCQMGL